MDVGSSRELRVLTGIQLPLPCVNPSESSTGTVSAPFPFLLLPRAPAEQNAAARSLLTSSQSLSGPARRPGRISVCFSALPFRKAPLYPAGTSRFRGTRGSLRAPRGRDAAAPSPGFGPQGCQTLLQTPPVGHGRALPSPQPPQSRAQGQAAANRPLMAGKPYKNGVCPQSPQGFGGSLVGGGWRGQPEPPAPHGHCPTGVWPAPQAPKYPAGPPAAPTSPDLPPQGSHTAPQAPRHACGPPRMTP